MKNANPYISVIIPTHNRSSLLILSLKSVYDSFKTSCLSYEIVVVDDCSTDDTLSSLEHFISTHHVNCKIIRNTRNVGVSVSRNRGAKHAKGHWFLFLDSDDTLLINAASILETYERLLCDTPFILTPCSESASPLPRNNVGEPDKTYKTQIDFRWLFSKEHTSNETLLIVRGDLFKQVFFEESLSNIGFERLTVARIMSRSNRPGLYLNIPLRFYRSGEHHSSLSTQKRSRQALLDFSRGHQILLEEFWNKMPTRYLLCSIVKVFLYRLYSILC